MSEFWVVLLSTIGVGIMGVLTFYVTRYLKERSDAFSENEDLAFLSKYLEKAVEVIQTVVIAINQTYVDDIREKSKDGKLTPEEQAEAFNLAKDEVLELLSDEMKTAISYFYGDIDKWVDFTIESLVKLTKK
ncbi:MAG: hypothetical protein PHF63_00910 [Herbinix sp.]|nr:hypothetical protein [Herbinix sp.]